MFGIRSTHGSLVSNVCTILGAMLIVQLAFIVRPTECNNEKTRVCGNRLVKMLNQVCKRCFHGGGFLIQATAKRSELYEPRQLMSLRSMLESVEWSSENNADNELMYQRHTRGVQGIVEECCLKQCSYQTLKSYCATDCEWLKKNP